MPDPLAGQGGHPVRETFLPFSRPSMGEEEKRAILEVLESGWITAGPRVDRLEEELSRYVGGGEVVCLDSCTAALHLALCLLDLEPGDEVVTTPLTFVSTVNAIVHAGGTPVLADVEDDTLNLSPAAFGEAITDRTRAVIPVHFGGHPAEMDPLVQLAREKGISVIEDAAHAIGASYKGRAAGTLGDAGCFSFYATKNMTTGEGGALVLPDVARAERARVLRLHGMSRDAWKRHEDKGAWYYEVTAPGFKYNMTDLEAALGLCQLARLDEFNLRRREIAARYDEGLAGVSAVTTPPCHDDVEHAYQLYPVRLQSAALEGGRGRFIEELTAQNIGTSVHFIPVHYHPYYRECLGLAPGALPVAEAAFEGLVSLPIYPAMTDADVDDVLAAVNKVVARLSI